MKYLSLLCLCIPFLLSAQQSSHLGAPKYDPGQGKQLLIVGQDLGAVGGLDAYTDGYVDHLGHVPAGITTYTGFTDLGGLREFANWGAGDVHAQAYLEDATFDHAAIAIGLYLVNSLGTIVNGKADEAIHELGTWIMEAQRPVFLRIGYEFDGPWNNYSPTLYQEAWRYIVHAFDTLGVKNVAYVWQAYGGNTAHIERWYPGDAYVNWVAYSHFDEPNPGANILAFAEEHDKPVMIAESTPRRDLKEGSGQEHWDSWYAPLFRKISDHERIRALAYIHVNWDSQSMWTGNGWGDSRLQVSDTVRMHWEKEIADSSWVLASDSLFEQLAYQLWQDSTVDLTGIGPVGELELQAWKHGSHLLLRSPLNDPLEDVFIWDLQGRLLHRERSNSEILRLPLALLPDQQVVIIGARCGNRHIRTKCFLPSE